MAAIAAIYLTLPHLILSIFEGDRSPEEFAAVAAIVPSLLVCVAVYSLAAEMNVPVLIHFADFPQSEGQVPGTPGIKRFPAVVKANPLPQMEYPFPALKFPRLSEDPDIFIPPKVHLDQRLDHV